MSNIYLPQPGTLTLPGIDDIEGNAAGTSGVMATGEASASLPQPGSLVLPGIDDTASDSVAQRVNLPAVDTPPEMASSVNGATESDMPPLLQPGPSPVDFLETGIGAAGVGGFDEPETLRRPTSFDRAAFMMRGISNVSLDDAVLAYLAKTTAKVEFDVALRHIPTTKKVLNAIEWFDRLDAMDTQRQEALLNKETATLVKEDISAWQKFGDILSAPSNWARDMMSSKTMAEALAVLPRAPFNISESTYQGVQALGGLMQLAGLTDAGQTVEQFGRYHADKAREILRQLSPVGGRISSEEILNNPWRLFSDEGLAWLIGSVGDTGAKQLPSILGYMSNPLLGAALGGTSEGVAFYEQLRQDNVSVYNALLQAAAFGGATGLLDRIGLDAMLPQYAPRTANHILDRAMGVVGDRLDRGIARLPRRIQPVVNAVRAGGVEGVTEYLENPIQGALEGVAKEEGGKDIWGRTKEGFSDWTVILPAAVLGGGMRSVAGRTPPVERRAIEDSGGSGGDDGGAPFVSTQETVSRIIDKTLLSELKTEIEEVARYEQAANERITLGEALKQAAEIGDATRVKSKNAQAFEAGFRDMVPERYATLWLDPETVVQYAQGALGLAEGEAVPAIAEGEQAARLSQIGLNPEQLQEAIQSGAPIAVETIAVASMDAGPVREALFDAARQAPDGMTAQEAARFEPEKLLDGAVKRVRTSYQERQDVIREERRLVDEIAAVGFPEHVARDYATVLRANAEAYQGRYGADAAALLRQISIVNADESTSSPVGNVNATALMKNRNLEYYQTAYHGTPHRFDKFTLEAIGTGEGAQAFGWGLYFAGNKDIAEWYRKKLAPIAVRVDGELFIEKNEKLVSDSGNTLTGAEELAARHVVETENINDAVELLKEHIQLAEKIFSEGDISEKDYRNSLAKLEKAIVILEEKSIDFQKEEVSQTYSVDIPENNVLLNRDVPLSEQTEEVKEILKQAGLYSEIWLPKVRERKNTSGKAIWVVEDDMGFPVAPEAIFKTRKKAEAYIEENKKQLEHKQTGADLYSILQHNLGSDRAASEYLNSLGIKGLRYVDGLSRRRGNGSFNYVIFDDSAIQILETYYQSQTEQGKEPRGSVSFGRTPEGEGRAIIRIFNGRDLSTVLHEGAHIWTRNLEDIADGGANTALQSFDLRVSQLGAMPDVLTDIALRAQEAVQSEKPAEALRGLAKEARQVQDTANAADDSELARMAVRVATELNRLRRNLSGMEQARQDIRSLREYAGVSLEGSLSQEERRVFYERVAAGAEAYFMEGKAPNAALQRIFDAFRNWLTAIYKSAKNLFGQAEFGGFELTDDVRAVFDRMLSTDDRLAQARRRADLLSGAVDVNSALSDNLGEAVSQKELDELNALLGDVERAATEQMDAATLKDRKKRLAEFRKIAAEALEQEPFWQAVDYLSGKDIGLNRDLLEVDYGKDSVRDLMRVKRSLVRSKGGVQLDVVATELGYPDADTLWNEMQDRLVAGGQTKQGEINRRAQEMLDAEDAHIVENVDEMAGDAYGRYLDALELAANRMLGKARGMAYDAMRHFAESVRTPRSILADRAATEIANTRITNIRPDRYNAALRKAQREIARAMREEETIASLRALDEARLSNELYVQAVKTRRWVEELEARSRKAARIKPDTINELAREGLRRVLSRFDLANVSAVPYVRGDEAISLREIVTALSPDVEFVQTDDGSQRFASGQSNVVLDSFPGWLLDDRAPSPEQPVDASGYIHHRQLTPNQLRDVENLIKYLEHRGREMSRANKASEAARVEAQAVAGAAPMQALKPRSIPEEGSLREKWRNLTSRLLAEFDNLRSTFLRADGFSNVKKGGKVGFNEEMLLQPLLDGESRKKVLWRGLNSELAPHIEQMTTSIAELNKKYGEKLGSLKRRDGTALLVPEKMREIGRSWSFERVFGMALQLGNRSNMDRLVSGFRDLDMETVAVLLGDDVAGRLFKDSEGNPALNPLAAQYGRTDGVLTGADWKAVQGIWDSIESLWPDTVQTHEQLFGFAPQKIDAEPMSLMRDGERVFLKGGYFPAKYDPKLSDTMAARQEVEDILRDPNLKHGAPSAKRSHTKARAEGAPGESLRLDLGQIMQHLEEATTFIALGPTVRHVDRVTRNPVWRSAYVRAFGEQEYNAIRENLKALVQKERTDTAGQDFANMARKFLTYNALSWNMNTVMMQTDALFKSAADQGWKSVLDGLGKLVSGSPIQLIREVEAASPYMESRSKNLDRDLAKSVTDISKMAREKSYRMLSLGKVKVGVEQAAELGMKPMQAMDQVISTAIWIGAYQAKMRELGVDTIGIDSASKHHSVAVRHADNMVKRANPDYDATSRTKFQRHPFYSMTNMFASATTLIFQRQRLQAQALRAGETTLPEYAVWQFNDTLLPALAFWLFSEACIGAFSDDDKKRKHYKKDWVQRYMEETLDYAAPSVPVAGPVLASLLVGGQRSSSQTVLDRPLQVFGRTFAKTRGYLSDERGKNKHTTAEDVANAMIDTVGFVTKIPTQRFRKYGENVLNLLD